jgi:hypothetical protein
VAAFLIGAVPAVVFGGAMTIVIALSWGRIFPSLARVDRTHELRPEAEDRDREMARVAVAATLAL